jgi:hypothetical protein
MKILIPGYGGGLANSKYAPLEEQSFQTAENLDVFQQQRILRPVVNLASQTFDVATNTFKPEFFYKASNNQLFWFGSDGSQKMRIYNQNLSSAPGELDITVTGPPVSPLANDGSSSSSADNYAPDANNLQSFHHVAELNGYLLFWSATKLSRITLGGTPSTSSTWAENPFTFSVTANTGHPIFTHQGLRKVFIAVDNVLYSFDSTTIAGSAVPTTALTLDPAYVIKSITSSGRFVVLGCISKRDTTTSKLFIYDGSATTVDDIIDIGDYGLQAVRNVNGILNVLCTNVVMGVPGGYTRVYLVNGNSVVLGDEIIITPGTPTYAANKGSRLIGMIDDASVDVWGDRLIWAYRGRISGPDVSFLNITNGIYAYGKFESNQPRIITLLNTPTTSAAGYSFTCVRVIEGYIYAAFNNQTNWYIETQASNSTWGARDSSGVYESNVFTLNSGNMGKISKITLFHDPLPASCGFTVQVKHYGHYTRGSSIPVEDSYATVYGPEGNSSTSGMSQSTQYTTYTVLEDPNVFKKARFAQIKILFDEVNGVDAPGIVFPILIETEEK